MYEPLVSIIIPVYNAESYVDAAIQSALQQTWVNKEIIIVDDGSTDNSLAIAKKHEGVGITVLTQPNSGASTARNKGIAIAKGEYIQFLDADDLLSATKIETQVKVLVNHTNHIAFCPTRHFMDGTLPVNKQHTDIEIAITDPLYFLQRLYGGKLIEAGYEGMIQPNAWLTPRTVIEKAGNWNENLTLDDDGEYFCRVVLASAGVIYIPQTLSFYRKYITPKSLSANKSDTALKSALLSIQLKYEHLKKVSNTKNTNIALAKVFLEYAVAVYPAHKDLYNAAMHKLNQLPKIEYVPAIGGPQTEFLKNVFGWRLTKWLQHIFIR
jgi:glycosyltransferase involved in cell wall biosynthesis